MFQSKLQKHRCHGEDILVNQWSNVSLLKSLPFEHNGVINDDSGVSISDLARLAQYEFVTLKAQVATVEETMEVKSRNGEPLTKQEIAIRDATGSCTVILYEQYVELMEAGKSYKMENLRLRKSYDHYYLNTSEKKIATFTPIDDLQDLTGWSNQILQLCFNYFQTKFHLLP